MATYVLVHGSNQGGWIWQPLANRLRAAGHHVYAPSLDGCGERKGQMRPGITAKTQADEVAQLMFYEGLKDVVLVGTSYGGMVACRAAELMRERISRLVFDDALTLFDGEKVADILPHSTSVADGVTLRPSSEDVANRLFADLNPKMRAWALERWTPHPIAFPLPTGQARFVLVAAMESERNLVPPGSEPGRSTPATCRRAARRQVDGARHRPLPDAEHANGTDRAIDRRVRGRRTIDTILNRSADYSAPEHGCRPRCSAAASGIPVAAHAVHCPWGEPRFTQPPGKGQIRRRRLLVAVPTERGS